MSKSQTLERQDSVTGKWILYRDQAEHSADCDTYPYDSVPRRIFLDTSVFNLLAKYSDHVFEHVPLPADMDRTRAHDVEALMHTFWVGTRANWMLIASSKTLDEIRQTPNRQLRETLEGYAGGIAISDGPAASYARDLGRRVIGSDFFSALPGTADRELIAHAIGLNCDVFCTVDRKTIVRKRDKLPKLPLKILTPVEWWHHVRPWAGLCC